MSQILLVAHDSKNNQVTLRGRNLNGTYPANGYLVAANDTSQPYVTLSLPGSVVLESQIDYKDIKDATTNLNLGGTNTATVAALNSDYFNVETSLNGFDDVDYDPTSLNNDYILQWNTDHWAEVELTPNLVGAMDADAALDDLSDVDAGSAADGQVLTWVDADGEWKPTTVSGGGGGSVVDADDLSDVSTTGVATGDGLRYDGTDFVAGKWGVGTEDQTIPANSTTTSSTSRVVKLETDTTYPTNLTSITTLDVVNQAGDLMESIRSFEIDVGAGPSYISTQNKYGTLTNKMDADGNIGKIGFNGQYADGGNNMYLKCTSITTPYELNFPAIGSATAGQVLGVKSGSATTDTDLEWITPSGGGGGSVYTFTDTGRRQWTSSQDNWYHIGDSGFGMNDTSKNYAVSSISSGNGLADLFMFNGWCMPAAVTSVTISGTANTFSAGVYGEDLQLILLKVTHTSADDCTLSTLTTLTETLGTASGDVAKFSSGAVSVSVAENEVIIPVFRFPNANTTSTTYVRYGVTLTAS